jgi:hypothetical protein
MTDKLKAKPLLPDDAYEAVMALEAENKRLRQEVAELRRLLGEVAGLRRLLGEAAELRRLLGEATKPD